MRGLVIGLVAGLALVGCGRGAVAEKNVTADEFWEMMYGKDVELAKGDMFFDSALRWVQVDPPMDGLLIDAMADPFAMDAEWKGEGQREVRLEMLGKLKAWREEVGTVEVVKEYPAEDVVSRFGAVVAARVLESQLLKESGDQQGAEAHALGTAEMVREVIGEAPRSVVAELVPQMVIASEALVRVLESEELYNQAVEIIDLMVVAEVGISSDMNYRGSGLEETLAILNNSQDAVEMGMMIDPFEIEQGGKAVGTLKDVLNFGGGDVDWKATAKLAGGQEESRSDFGLIRLEAIRQEAEDEINGAWGVDVFATPIGDWNVEVVKGAVKKSRNEVGVLIWAHGQRAFASRLESAMAAQMALDGAKLSLARKFGKSAELVDPFFGKPYQIANGVLRTMGGEVKPEFIFAQHLVQNGVPLLY